MKERLLISDYIFETSWEVCNKVGGIYTVLSTQARTLQHDYKDHLFYIGPDIWKYKEKGNPSFLEDTSLLKDWREKACEQGIAVRIGRWNIPGLPIVFLVDYSSRFQNKDEIYATMWKDFGVDSLKAYGDYDESCMFSLTAAKLVEFIYSHFLRSTDKVVYQAHEWMSGCGLLYIKKHCPKIGTIFTTHATSIGRSITTNEKPLYDYFKGYNGDQMAQELHMEAKHSIEKQAALHADCLTTVSEATDKECEQFFGRKSDVILMNGFEEGFIPKGFMFSKKREKARETILNVANKLMGTQLNSNDTFIISTSGRNDFRCKGFDVLIDAFSKIQKEELKQNVLALIAVPCWKKGPREDLQKRLLAKVPVKEPLDDAFITHTLYNMESDRIISTMRSYGISYEQNCKFHVLLCPTYLDGKDGIFNLTYYDWLIGNDFCLYPSYYEPWGYTCLESISFGIPCLTTDLTGFGQWVNKLLGHEGRLQDGVVVIKRTDSNYEAAASEIVAAVGEFVSMSDEQRASVAKNAVKIAHKALWKDFIKNYYTAYGLALKKAMNRNS